MSLESWLIPCTPTNRIAQIWLQFGITKKIWENAKQDLVMSMVLENLFPVCTGNIETDYIMQAMQNHNILDLDNNHQELYNKVC